MFTLYRNTSPSSTRAKLSRRLTRPSRIDLTSVPRSTIPASNVSSRWKSWNAFRFSAMEACAFSRSVLSANGLSARFGRFVGGVPRSGELRREQHGRDHALGIGFASARDVERRSMVDRRADDRQSERHVDRGAEGQQLDRYQSLIVVAGDHDLELAALCADEEGIGRKRTGDVDAACAACGDRRRDDVALLAAEQPVLAGVRVEPGDGNS